MRAYEMGSRASSMKCPACGRDHLPGAVRCGGCSTPLPSPATGVPGATSVTSVSGAGSGGGAGVLAPGQKLAPGMSLGTRYQIQAVLGEGGAGMVYRARDRELNRTVALKIIRPEIASRPGILERLKREIMLASQITHKNVVRIHDLGEAGELRFISMSCIEGESLRALLEREGPLSPDRGVPLVRQIALALQAAHDAGIVHRDLKPHNVLLDRDGQPYVGDFGISRSLAGEGTMTGSGAIFGTVDYMSPEQARGDASDHRSDIYALGAMMFEMFTGTLPFRAANPLSAMARRVQEDAPQASQARPGMPPWLSAIILRAMQRDPQARYQSLADLVRDLDRQRAARAARRLLGRRVALAAGVLLAAGLAAAGGMRLLESRATAPTAVKTSLAVLPFRNGTGDARFDWVRTGVTSAVRTGLLQARALRLAGDDRVEEILGVLKPGEGEEARPATAQRIGKLVGVENLLAGSLLKAGGGFRIEASVMSVGDAAITATRPIVIDGAGEGSIPAMMDDLTRRVREELGVSKRWGEKPTGAAELSSRSVEALALYGDALALARSGNQLDAARRLEAAVVKDPQFAMAEALLAETYDALGYGDKAKEAVDRAAQMARNASSYETAYLRAVRARIAQDLDSAVKAYAEICDLIPNSAEAFFDLGSAQEQRGDLDRALLSFRQAVSLDPRYPAAHYRVGRVLAKMGSDAEGIGEFKTALDLHRAAGNDEGSATVLNGLGNAYLDLSQYDEASRHFEEALESRRRIGDRRGVSVSLINLSIVRRNQGRYDDAVRLAQESIVIAKEIGYTSGVADGYSRLGDVYQTAGRAEDALAAYQESLNLMREVGDEGRLAYTLSSVGYIDTVLGRYVDAFFFLKQALAKRRAIGDKGEIVRSLIDLGVVEQFQGRYEEALGYDTEGLALAREVGEKLTIVSLLSNLANIHEDRGNYATALALLDEGRTIADEMKDASLQATILTCLGSVRRRIGDAQGSRQVLDEALRLARELDNTSLIAEILSYRSDLLLGEKQTRAATADVKEALAAARKTGDRWRIQVARLQEAKIAGPRSGLESALEEAQLSGLAAFIAPAHLELARLDLEAGRSKAGADHAARAVQAATPLGQKDVLFQAHHLAAKFLQAQGKVSEAADQAAAALPPLEEMRQGLKGEFLTQFLGRRGTVAFARDAEKTLHVAGRTREVDRLRLALTP